MIKNIVSRTKKNVCEKFDKDNWMLLSKFNIDDDTSYLDVCKLVYYKNESSDHKENVDIEWIFSKAK